MVISGKSKWVNIPKHNKSKIKMSDLYYLKLVGCPRNHHDHQELPCSWSLGYLKNSISRQNDQTKKIEFAACQHEIYLQRHLYVCMEKGIQTAKKSAPRKRACAARHDKARIPVRSGVEGANLLRRSEAARCIP
jgi:hypothetical protein